VRKARTPLSSSVCAATFGYRGGKRQQSPSVVRPGSASSEEPLRRILLCAAALASCGRLRFGPPPEIRSFGAESDQAGWGEPLALHWSVVGADEFFLDGVGRVGSEGAIVRPTRDTDYVLRASGLGGDVASAPLHVRVTASLGLAVGSDDARNPAARQAAAR